jgi:hypothetical protein
VRIQVVTFGRGNYVSGKGMNIRWKMAIIRSVLLSGTDVELAAFVDAERIIIKD